MSNDDVSEHGGVRRLAGTHLRPQRFFGGVNSLPALTYDNLGDVLHRTKVGSTEVLVTRAGGLFSLLPEDAPPLSYAENDAMRRITTAFDHVICNLALSGEWAEPAAWFVLGRAFLSQDNTRVQPDQGSLEFLAPWRSLRMVGLEDAQGWQIGNDGMLVRAFQTDRALALGNIAAALPRCVAAAYWFIRRGLHEEAVVECYLVVEQILNHLWKRTYLSKARTPEQQKRLKDDRTYSASVKAEVLLAAGVLDSYAYDVIQAARKDRNDVAHSLRLNSAAGQHSLDALMWAVMAAATIKPPASVPQELTKSE